MASSTPQLYPLAPLPDRFAGVDEDQRADLLAVCRRPELRPLLYPVPPMLGVASDVTPPFRLTENGDLLLSPSLLAHPPALAWVMRFALELRLWRAHARPEHGEAPLLWSAHGAALFFQLMVRAEQVVCQAVLPAPLLALLARLPDLAGTVHVTPAEVGAVEEILAALRPLAPPSVPPTPAAEIPALLHRWRGGVILAKPLELLLTEGGDSRMCIDPETGLSDYGCSPRPRPWAITFASSTASSISDLAFHHAEAARQGVIAQGLAGAVSAEEAFDVPWRRTTGAWARGVRRELEGLLGLPELPDGQMVLTSSGTDTELIALHLAACHPEGGDILNILIAPRETGSGVLLAAGGRHFLSAAPHEEHQEKGSAVKGLASPRVTVRGVPVRSGAGEPLRAEAICAEVEALMAEGLERGERILLHVVDSAKTGLGAPPIPWVREQMARHPERLDVVVDACQFRLSPAQVRAYLRMGCMVLITGSKFFTGPPFSGALLVPPDMARRVRAHGRAVPEGLSAYLTRADWPEAWSSQAGALPEEPNLGLLFRWQAALWEMKALLRVPVDERRRILTLFAETVGAALAADPVFDPLPTPVLDRAGLGDEEGWAGLRTIFTFRLRRADGQGGMIPMTEAETRRVYHLLNRDITAMLPPSLEEATRRLAAKRCHIGQPVAVGLGPTGEPLGALRLSGGARLVYGVLHDPELGATPEQRLQQELGDAVLVLRKVALIVSHWASLEGEAIPPPDQGDAPLYQV